MILSKHSLLWIAFLVLASAALSIQFACAVPLVAFAVIAALSMPPRPAIAMVFFAWLVNQMVGYGLLGYPVNTSSFLWGGIIGASALVGLAACMFVSSRLAANSTGLRVLAMFIAGFAVYQGTMYSAALALGETENFTLQINTQILLVNALGLVGLLVAEAAARSLGLHPAQLPSKPNPA